MSIQVWIDEVFAVEQDLCTPPPECSDGDKENIAHVHYEPTAKRRRLSASMEGTSPVDAEVTPRPNKRRLVEDNINPPEHFSSSTSSISSVAAPSSGLESHKSGRLSPTKQLTALEDREEPVIYYDFATTKAKPADDVLKLRMEAQLLSDGVSILGFTKSELSDLTGPNSSLDMGDQNRFGYPWANDLEKRCRIGEMVPLTVVQSLTKDAVACEEMRSHEGTWNEMVHLVAIKTALASSAHTKFLKVIAAKTAKIDPPSLASLANETLPRRIIDYAIVLVPDERISRAWKMLRPLAKAGVKSWNHTTTTDLRSTPIASSIETKAPNKSWTDGKAQLAIWTAALHQRLRMLRKPGKPEGDFQIPAMPLLVAQGHDWHLLIVSRQTQSGDEVETIIWQKIDVGSTRNCFDTYKLLATLHMVADWAYTIWRPWFHELIGWMAT